MAMGNMRASGDFGSGYGDAGMNTGIFWTGGGNNTRSSAEEDRDTWMRRNPGQPYPGQPSPGDSTQQTANPFQSQMDAHLQGAAPAYRAPGQNRFEKGLASSEKRLSALLEDPNSIQQSAAYKFRVGQGMEGLNRSLAAKGMAGSGNRLTELTDYMQGQASQEYGNQFGRLKDLTGMYAGNWNQAQGTNVQEALGRFGTETQGHSARGATLANLFNTAANPWTSAGKGQTLNRQTGQITTGGAGMWG